MEPKKAVITRPESGEYAPYYEKYISLVKGNDILGALEGQRLQVAQMFGARSEREGNFRYAPDKWTVKEVLGHVNDTERIFAYRALRIARGDQTPLSGFEQDDYVRGGNFAERTLAEIIDGQRGEHDDGHGEAQGHRKPRPADGMSEDCIH